MAERQLKMARSRVFSFVTQLPGFRDSHSRTSSVSNTASPVSSSSPALSAATSPSSSPPSLLPHQKTSTPPLQQQQRLSPSLTASSPTSVSEPFPEILPVNTPPTPPNEYECARHYESSRSSSGGRNSPIEPIPEDELLVNISRSNSGHRSSSTKSISPTSATFPSSIDHRPRGYSVASNYSGRERSSSRPASIVQAYQPPVMDITDDIPAELQPTFTFLNNHGSKLYQEGYFLKLDDQNAQGRANSDRTWHECFAQLVGTVLSLWDAAELDAAGDDGEVLPKFINITDASIKMIESLKMSTDDSQTLQNILSISTAGRNRYLLHFNSHHSLIQWTSAIRLAMFEHASLQEAYTGALIAGKARALNNINIIMERTVLPSEDWVRVRFGAGMPWRRCWCVITPPSVKDLGKAQKEMKKRSPYDRSAPVLKGDIKFYDTRFEGRKLKKAKPIATITDAFAAYAIYPQAKALIDASTLIKVEGDITIHSEPPSSSEGFVFMMPEVHPAVSGFETLLKVLFPIWDTFALYGRPGKLVASPLDSRALMFAMPRHKRYGYLEILDVSGLVTATDNDHWSDREWRKRLKELTGQRRAVLDEAISNGTDSFSVSRAASRRSSRASFGMGSLPAPPKLRVGFSDANPANRTSRSFSLNAPTPPKLDADLMRGPSDGPTNGHLKNVMTKHARNSSDPEVAKPLTNSATFPLFDSSRGPTPVHQHHLRQRVDTNASEGPSSDDERSSSQPTVPAIQPLPKLEAPAPVARPPKMNRDPASRPLSIMYHSPETHRANNRLSNTTLSQLAKAGRVDIDVGSGMMHAQESDGVRGQQHQNSPQSFQQQIPPQRQNSQQQQSFQQQNYQRQNSQTAPRQPPHPQHPSSQYSRTPPPGAEPFPDLQSDYANAPPIPPMSGRRSQSPARGQQAAPPPIPVSMRPGQGMVAPVQLAPPPGHQGRGFGPGPPPPSPGVRNTPPGPPGPRNFPFGPPSPGMRPPGPMNPQYRSPSPSVSSGGPPPVVHRQNQIGALPQRTTSLQNAHGPVRSATADAVGIDRGRAHRQDSDLSGSRTGARPAQLGIPTAHGDPDLMESPTDYVVSQWELEWDRQDQQQRQQQQQQQSHHHQQQHHYQHPQAMASPSFPNSRPQSPARMPSAPRSYTPQVMHSPNPDRRMAPPQAPFTPDHSQDRRMAPPQAPFTPDHSQDRRMAPPQAPFSPDHSQNRMRTGSPGPGRAISPDPRMLGGAAPSPRAPPSLARSASYDVVEPNRPFAEIARPGSSNSMRVAGEQIARGSSPLVKLASDPSMMQGLGIVERTGAQRAPAQTVFAQHAQPQRPVIIDPTVPAPQSARIQMASPPTQSLRNPMASPPPQASSFRMSPQPLQNQRPPPPNVSPLLHPGGFTASPLQSPHRSPVMGMSPKVPSPMSATFGHVGSTSPPQQRGVSPRPQGRMVPPPQGQYAVPSRPGTPQLGPQFHGQAF